MKIAAIGCSFTNYVWPSYADVLQADNYGLSGIGNERIWHTLLHLYKTDKLQTYDAIILQWTSPYRFDYLTTAGWTPNDGNISTSVQNVAIWKNIRSWYNEAYELEKSKNYVITAKCLLHDLNMKTYHMSMTDALTDLVDLSNLKDKYTGRYKFSKAPWTNKPFQDDHPNLLNHLDIAKQIADNFGIKIDQNIYSQCMDFHLDICITQDFAEVDKKYRLNFPNRYIATGF